jgi:ferredoxin-NADP reductase
LKIIYTITRLEKAKTWAGKTGRIDADLIQEHAGALDTPLYYVCGSLTMVNDIGRLLKDALNIAAEDMRTEKYPAFTPKALRLAAETLSALRYANPPNTLCVEGIGTNPASDTRR